MGEREECRLLLERFSVSLLMVRRLCMCAGDDGPIFQAWLVFHVLRPCDVVRWWVVRLFCGPVHLLQSGGVVRHGVAAVGRQASDRLAVVASLHCAALLLALLLLPYAIFITLAQLVQMLV